MPLKNYGVLVGRPIDRRLGTGQNPHYQIHIVDDDTDYRIAVNVHSKLAPSEVEYLIDDRFAHPVTTDLTGKPFGFHAIPSKAGGLAVDFIRGNFVDRTKFVPLPFNVAGPDNDLNEKLDSIVQRAMGDEDSVIYAFGERWGPEKKTKDKIFGFLPGNGIHDIHMNQANSGSFVKDDGVWQDGALLVHFPTTNQWIGIFLKFQSQAWHSDDTTGHRIEVDGGGAGTDTTDNQGFDPEGTLRIVAALVNAQTSPEIESVTIVNASPQAVDLKGWSLADKNKKKFALNGTIGAGDTQRITIAKPMELSNQGGIITLLDDDGLKVAGVSYSKALASKPGWTIVF